MNQTFQEYAIKRLARSGVVIDPSFVQFCHNESTRSLSIPEMHSTVLCIGSFNCFWLIISNNIDTWVKEHFTRKARLEEVKGKKAVYLELPADLPGSCFTPVPDSYFTEYESLVWLEEHKDAYKRVVDIVNNINY